MTRDVEWDKIVSRLPGAHVLQTAEWAAVKQRFGWQPSFWVWTRAGGRVKLCDWRNERRENIHSDGGSIVAAALLLVRSPPLPTSTLRRQILLGIGYCPKGPLLDWKDQALRQRVLQDLQGLAKKNGAVLLKIDPDVEVGRGIPGTETETKDPDGQSLKASLQSDGWRFSQEQIQFRNTFMLNLRAGEEEILSAMKQKTRYNIRLAGRRGVEVRVGEPADYPLLFEMYSETAARDGFAIRSEAYYHSVWQTFGLNQTHHLLADGSEEAARVRADRASNDDPAMPRAEALIASVSGEPAAAAVIFRFARRAWFLYGMSRSAHRDKMPGYLLQWEAIRRARAAGCQLYDFWGAPDHFQDSDRMWGVYRFKLGFRGEIVRHIGAWDMILSPGWYRLYKLLVTARRNLTASAG